jgi:hypothetical protein
MRIEIDHVTVCGQDLPALQDAFARAGLVADYGGPHASGNTHMAQLAFDDGSYLELIAPTQPGRAQGSAWEKLMLGNAGAGAWAVKTGEIRAEIARLGAAGIAASGPNPGSRRRPDGKLLEWETASIGPGSMGAVLPFLIQDHTSRSLRVQPSASIKGSGLTGIAQVVIGVTNLDSAVELFRRAFRWDEPLRGTNAEVVAQVAHFPGTPVVLASALDNSSPFAARLAQFGEIPAAFLFKATDLPQAAELFCLSRFAHSEPARWFGKPVAWFDSSQLLGLKLGVLQV